MAVNEDIERLSALVAWARENGLLALSMPDGLGFTLDPEWRPPVLVDPERPRAPERHESPEERAEREQQEYDSILFHSAT